MELLVGTLLLRPYVFAFLAAFLIAAAADVGIRRTLGFAGVVWPLAWLAEFASTRWGVPFGLYHYTGDTRGRELYVANVPFMDSLSFTFLAYAAFCLARRAWRGRRPSGAALAATAGGLMMLLDVVVDPVAVLGDRWFLGRVFYYAEPGAYFGVPLSNFAGWWLVGALGVGLWLRCSGWSATDGGQPGFGVGLYYAVLVFNLAVTAWLQEWLLLAAGVTLHTTVALTAFGLGLLLAPASPA
ncbi:MAG: carotenoid biosynthesis protein, partial [Candidatus Rokuibacteriota bacterium]